jgi:hypothetical protein
MEITSELRSGRQMSKEKREEKLPKQRSCMYKNHVVIKDNGELEEWNGE